MAKRGDEEPKTHSTGSKIRFWNPTIWTGMNVSGWYSLLIRHRFAVSPSRVGMVLILCVVSAFNSSLWLVQMLIYGRKIRRTRIEHDPIFIIGHWRSGTTLLHELLTLDSRFTYPNTYQCFAPNHFLVSTALIPWWLGVLMPARRPMDNMLVGWKYPQEEEFALCSMGLPSPYLQYAFPNQRDRYQRYLDLEDVSPKTLARWKSVFLWFLQCLTLRDPRCIVLKSPPHTCRIKILLDLFPKARFVHIVRDPYAVYPSTVKTWKRFCEDQCAQLPKHEGLEEQVLDTFQHMYEVFEQTRILIDPSKFCEIRYEDLVEDPVGQVRIIYESLDLGEFEKVLPALEEYAAKSKDYKINRHEVSDETREKITQRWQPYIHKYGYGSMPENG